MSLTRANAALIAGEKEYVRGASSGLSLKGAPNCLTSISCAEIIGVKTDRNISIISAVALNGTDL